MRIFVSAILVAASCFGANFSGASALEFAKKAVAFGPRPPGSEANKKLAAYIASQVKADGAELSPVGSAPREGFVQDRSH